MKELNKSEGELMRIHNEIEELDEMAAEEGISALSLLSKDTARNIIDWISTKALCSSPLLTCLEDGRVSIQFSEFPGCAFVLLVNGSEVEVFSTVNECFNTCVFERFDENAKGYISGVINQIYAQGD